MRHISDKKGKCAHFYKEGELNAKQIINFFLPQSYQLPKKQGRKISFTLTDALRNATIVIMREV